MLLGKLRREGSDQPLTVIVVNPLRGLQELAKGEEAITDEMAEGVPRGQRGQRDPGQGSACAKERPEACLGVK